MSTPRAARIAPARRFVALVAITLLAVMGLGAFWLLTYAPLDQATCAAQPSWPGCFPELRRPTLLFWSGIVTAVYLVLAIITVLGRLAGLRIVLALCLLGGIVAGGWQIFQAG